MQKKVISIVVLFVVTFTFSAVADEDLNDIIYQGVSKLEQQKNTPLVVSIGNFSYADKEIGSSFSAYIEEKIGTSLQEHPSFELFAREKLEQILELMEMSLTSMFEQESAVRVGNMKGIRALIDGRFFDHGTEIELTIRLTDIESGTSEKSSTIFIPKQTLPSDISVLPDNYQDAMFVLDQLHEVQNADNNEFVVKAWSKRGNGGTYHDGENLVVNFFANRDCYIKIFHIDVHKNTSLIFPNQFYHQNRIQGNKIFKIPDASYPFVFRLTEPYGTEFIKVIASTVQFKDIEASFENLGKASKGLLTRGLNVEARKEQITETMFSYTIIK